VTGGSFAGGPFAGGAPAEALWVPRPPLARFGPRELVRIVVVCAVLAGFLLLAALRWVLAEGVRRVGAATRSSSRTWASEPDRVSFTNASRSRPLKLRLWIKAFCCGFICTRLVLHIFHPAIIVATKHLQHFEI